MWVKTYVDRYISGCGLDGERSWLDVEITKVDLEDGDGDDNVLHLEWLNKLG